MQKWIFICGFVMICCAGFSQDRTAYIELYKSIAVSEMLRTGIPASIKLAQAMVESNCGKSELACKANNHFGIKCGNDWKGKSYKKEDDDFENGRLVKSCFREFKTVYDSYIAHSDFLTDPAKSKRYGHLFSLDATDYKGWAKGLSKAGYATDPQYANKIIDIIERYELHHLDSPSGRDLADHAPKKSDGLRHVQYQNDVRYALAQAGDNPVSLAERNDVTVRQIIRYNDDIKDEYQELKEGSFVYLQPKRSSYHGKQKVHLMKPGESLISISQQYGIKVDALAKRNGLDPGEIPAPNQKITLKGKSKNKLRTVDPYDIPRHGPVEKLLPVEVEKPAVASLEKPAQASVDKTVVVTPKEIKYDTASVQTTQIVMAESTHTVAKGETLYAISRRYQVSLDELKKMNNLSADTISIGQKLIVK